MKRKSKEEKELEKLLGKLDKVRELLVALNGDMDKEIPKPYFVIEMRTSEDGKRY